MKQHFAWYQVKDITNVSDVSCILAKENSRNYHDNDITAADVDESRLQWYVHHMMSHDLTASCDHRLATFPPEHNYFVKKVAVPEEVSVSCDGM